MSERAAGPPAVEILAPLPRQRTLALLLTLRCTAQCGECGTQSGPHVRSRLPEDQARRLIDQAAADRYELVVFTGGEPMLYGVGLRTLVAHARTQELLTRMVSNAFWARTHEKAARALGPLAAAGLGELNLSTGDEHVRFVPVERVLYAARAALDLGLRCAIMIETRHDNRINRDAVAEHPIFRKRFSVQERDEITFCESPWMPLDAGEQYSYPTGTTINAHNLFRRPGCDSVIDTTTVLADGRIMACCGLGTQKVPELVIGQVSEDDVGTARLRAESDFLKRWLRDEGPERILAWAASKDPSIKWEDQYAHKCQACIRLYTDDRVADAIFAHHEEKILDVLASEWLLRGEVALNPGSSVDRT